MNEHEKNLSIEYILNQGLVKPKTVFQHIREMLSMLGLRFIFWDTGYSLFFAAVTLAIALVLFNLAPNDYRYSAAIAIAPLGYLLMITFTETSERACGLYELKQVCHYTIQQITALRVTCYSVAGFVFTTVIAAVSAKDVYDFLSLLHLCLSALFICAALSLSIMRLSRSKWANAAYSAVWVFINAALPFSLNERWETVLSGAPVVIAIITAIIGAAVLVYQISKMLSEVNKYAVI